MSYTDGWRAYASVLKFVATPRLIALVGTAVSSGETYILEEELWTRTNSDPQAAAYIMETLPF